MSKPYKIKNYSDKTDFFSSKKRFRILKPLVGIAVFGVLVFIGISVYQPLKDFFSGNTKPNPLPEPPDIVSTEVTPAEPEPLPSVDTAEEGTSPVVELGSVKGLLLPLETARNTAEFDKFINSIPAEVNTVVIVLKNELGEVFYSSSVENATKWEAIAENPVDIASIKQKLEANNLKLAVKLAVFSDPIAARADLENNAIMHSSGLIWIDNTLQNGGKPWVTPYSQPVQNYNIEIAKELADLGANIIIFDYMRFPNDPTASANVKATDGVSRTQAIDEFYKKAVTTIASDSTRVTASIPLWTAEQKAAGNNTALYGGDPMLLAVQDWVVSIDELAPTSAEVTKLLSENSGKNIILFTPQSANYSALSNSDKEFIVY